MQGIADRRALSGHPKRGASWEGFAIEQVLRVLRVAPDEAFCWATHAGAEVDLLLVRGGRRFGFEIKYADAPRSTKSMTAAVATLGLEKLFVLYPGTEDYRLNETTQVIALRHIEGLAARLP